MVVAGHAVRHHTKRRQAGDVDIFVETSGPGAERVYSAITDIAGRAPHWTVADLHRPETYVSFKNDGYDIDAFTSAPGLEFDEVWRDADCCWVGDVPLRVISRSHLVRWLESVATNVESHRDDARRDLRLLDS